MLLLTTPYNSGKWQWYNHKAYKQFSKGHKEKKKTKTGERGGGMSTIPPPRSSIHASLSPLGMRDRGDVMRLADGPAEKAKGSFLCAGISKPGVRGVK